MKNTGTAVIGLGFGDEGKGRVVDWLCRSRDVSAVVRFSGGQQAAHHVISGDTDHVFASFGSGTLAGVPTYVMRHCTIDPDAIFNEYNVLKKIKQSPIMRIDGKCPVTTPYEKVCDVMDKKTMENGSCGMGVGNTWQREEDHFSLLAEDLLFPQIIRMKLELIRRYYQQKGILSDKKESNYVFEVVEKNFLKTCLQFKDTGIFSIENIEQAITRNRTVGYSPLFEGSQGLLLDPRIGFFPHVTRSTIGLDNILKAGYEPEVYLVTRAYQTRHGNGPMTNEHIPHNIRQNPYEKNGDDGPQGKFRVSLLDVDLLKYAIMKEPYLSTNREKLSLVITCLDLVENEWRFTKNGQIVNCLDRTEFVNKISDALGIDQVLTSDRPDGAITTWRQ